MLHRRLALPLSAMLLAACAHAPSPAPAAQAWSDAGQLVLVTTADWDATAGQLRRYERTRAGWRQVGDAAPITVGRAGTLALRSPDISETVS